MSYPKVTSESVLFLCQGGEEACQPGHCFGPAIRDHYLIHCIYSGSGWFEAGGKRHTLEAGDAFLITPGEVTTYAADHKTPWHYGWVGFGGFLAPSLLAGRGITREQPVFSFSSREKVQEDIRRLRALYYDSSGREFSLLAALYTYFDDVLPAPIQTPGAFHRTVDYIRKNYSYPLTICEMARHVGVDRSHLYRLFQQYAGTSPVLYLQNFRLQKAAALLRNTTLSVTEVLFSCGFSDPSHFSRTFKRRFGVCPSLFQKQTADGGWFVDARD